MEEIEQVVEQLFAKEVKKGCQALRILEAKSKESDEVYPYFDRFVTLMDDRNSYRRTRGLVLIAANAKWDTEHKVDVQKYGDSMWHLIYEDIVTALREIEAQ